MLVEFVGASGAGKSTLARAVIDSLVASESRSMLSVHEQHYAPFGFRIAWLRSERLQHLFLDLVLSPVHVLTLVKRRRLIRIAYTQWKFHGDPFLYRLNYLRNLLRVLSLEVVIRKVARGSRIALVDEGTLQSAHSAFVRPDAEPGLPAIREYLRATPVPDMVVLVKTSESLLFERAVNRSDLPIAFNRSDSETLRKRAAVGLLFSAMLPEILAGMGVRTVSVETGPDPRVTQAVVQHVVGEIKAMAGEKST
jgi:hypothetical protein